MTDTMDSYLLKRHPTAARPLLGLTVLLVEDSRFASEAVRLMCLRSGARIRRADCIASAHRHLRTYRPSVVIVDLGLPDGSGTELIAELVAPREVPQLVLATSGAADGRDRALAAGARGFLEKPIASLGAFQQQILALLPPESRPRGPCAVSTEEIIPDPMAFRDDIAHAAELLNAPSAQQPLVYIAQFVAGIARTAKDAPLRAAAEALAATGPEDPARAGLRARLHAMIAKRLTEPMII